MGNVSREMEPQRKNQKEMLHCDRNEECLDGLIRRLDISKERMNERNNNNKDICLFTDATTIHEENPKEPKILLELVSDYSRLISDCCRLQG